MSGLRGYVYDSINPDMPIIAAVFDAMDDLIKIKVVGSAEEGAKFIADTLISHGAARPHSVLWRLHRDPAVMMGLPHSGPSA
jgi:hypothetical protein